MALVSSIYGLAPSDEYFTREEEERRLKAKCRRLVEQYGQAEVLRRIRAWPVRREDEALKAWVVLAVYAVESRRGGTL